MSECKPIPKCGHCQSLLEEDQCMKPEHRYCILCQVNEWYDDANKYSDELEKHLDNAKKEIEELKKIKSCPCEYPEVEPCDPYCSCFKPHTSRGCARCARYGSYEQRVYAAKRLSEQEVEIGAQKLRGDLLSVEHDICHNDAERLRKIVELYENFCYGRCDCNDRGRCALHVKLADLESKGDSNVV